MSPFVLVLPDVDGPPARHALSVHPVYDLDLANARRVALGHPDSAVPGAFQVFAEDGRGNGSPATYLTAEDVARRLNAHDELVAALRDVLSRLESPDGDFRQVIRSPNPSTDGPALERARAALAKVTP